MVRRILICMALACSFLLAAGCNHKVQNPLSNIDSKQPDKALFDRAMDSMRHNRFEEARNLLETLINTYTDSEYMARAKLAIGDAWYAEGGNAAWQEAEVQYKDFQTFFPNLPEAAEAQLKVATIHYKQIEKSDRDYAQAQRAAEEYKVLIQQYPDSPMVPDAKQKLRDVQEVLADRQFRIANFYYLRLNYAASQARLQSLLDSYPLYSEADEALFELGNVFEREADGLKKQKIVAATEQARKEEEARREKASGEIIQKAIEAYSRIITRYPATDRVGDAKHRLEALHAPVPTPTPEAIAQSKAEEESRSGIGLIAKVRGQFNKHPNLAHVSKVGDPNLSDEEVKSAAAVVQDLNKELAPPAAAPSGKVGLEAIGTGTGAVSDSDPVKPAANDGTSSGPGANTQPTANAQPRDGAPPPQAPPQTNEVQRPTSPDAQGAQNATENAQKTDQSGSKDNKQDSSSKKKKKKGLHKLIPF